VIVGFGSTDCSAGCGGHLLYLPKADVEKVKSIAVECFKHLGFKPIFGSTYVRELF
jgi:hypothetical protein